ncbi:LysR family transcriptional regulator [Arthrobacter castelli]|uniref:LysR family transcriptional regulator n=1 Tax=Arthrobacter castelli TaxID=271431 RepID=UPI0004044B20|nr:LysR family transcriptional regulator [Arthrobacter castelli]
MNLNQLRYFVEVARRGSASAAAKELFVAQPTVSTEIRRLERELQCELFTRAGRSLALSSSGRHFLPYAENVISSVTVAHEAMISHNEMISGTVRFGYLASAHKYMIGSIARNLHTKFPGVNFEFRGLNSAHVADLVRDGVCDAGLVMIPIADHGLSVSPPISTQPQYYWTAAPERVAPKLSIADIIDRPMVISEASWRDSDPLRLQLTAAAQRRGLVFTPTVEVEFQDAAIQIAAEGTADTIASPLIVNSLGFGQILTPVEIDEPMHESLAIATRGGMHSSKPVIEFRNALEAVFR